MEKAIALCPENEDSYIIGGGEIYTLGLQYADIIEITRVHHTFDADAFFPKINEREWQLVESEENFRDDTHLYDYTYETYIRK
jgi:dihydrofolate reductase